MKEIFDKTNELKQDPQYMIFNQFEEMGNHLWHYKVTGNALGCVRGHQAPRRPDLPGACFHLGSAGTMSCGDY